MPQRPALWHHRPDKNKARDHPVAGCFIQACWKVLADDLAEGDRIDAEFPEVAGARTAAGFDSGTDGICGAERGECTTKETGMDGTADSGHCLFLSLCD